MSLPQKNQQQQQAKFDLDPEVVKSLVQQQALKLQIEQQRIKIDEKKVEQDGKLAEKSLELNAQLLKAEPLENRKSITRMFWIVFGILCLVFGVLTLWLYIGKEEFAYKFLQGASYFATTAIGYYVGNTQKKKNRSDNDEGISDAEIID